MREKDRDMRNKGKWDKDRHIRIKRSVRFKGEKDRNNWFKGKWDKDRHIRIKCPIDSRE